MRPGRRLAGGLLAGGLLAGALSPVLAPAGASPALHAGAAQADRSDRFPPFTKPVVDEAGVVPDDVERRVDAELLDYQARTGNQLAVAVVSTTGGRSIEDYSIDLARAWGVGQKEKDNGVVLVIAHEDRRLRIEVGRGLEGTLTDVQSGRIIRHRLVPLLRAGDVGGAVVQGTHAIRQELGDPEVGRLPAPAPEPAAAPDDAAVGWLMVAVAAMVIIALSSVARRRGRRGWGGTPVIWGSGWGTSWGGGGSWGGSGGGGGGFGGGGGGGFGGGGASGGW